VAAFDSILGSKSRLPISSSTLSRGLVVHPAWLPPLPPGPCSQAAHGMLTAAFHHPLLASHTAAPASSRSRNQRQTATLQWGYTFKAKRRPHIWFHDLKGCNTIGSVTTATKYNPCIMTVTTCEICKQPGHGNACSCCWAWSAFTEKPASGLQLPSYQICPVLQTRGTALVSCFVGARNASRPQSLFHLQHAIGAVSSRSSKHTVGLIASHTSIGWRPHKTAQPCIQPCLHVNPSYKHRGCKVSSPVQCAFGLL